MPTSPFNRLICRHPSTHHVPARKPHTITFQFDLPSHISDVKWATDYPGCKLLIELDPLTFTPAESSEECADTSISHQVQKITKGDQVIFNEYSPGFVYEYTRVLGLKDHHYHVEIVAFDLDGHYFSEASSVLFPCVVAIPAYLIDLKTFYT